MSISEKDLAEEIFRAVSENLASSGYKSHLNQDGISYILSRGVAEVFRMYFNEEFKYLFIEEYQNGYSGFDVYSTKIQECCTVGDICRKSIVSEILEVFTD